MKVTAYAKLNLDLHILGLSNGYHMLRSCVTTVNVGDDIEITPRTDKEVRVNDMANIGQYDNIAYKVARMVVDCCGTVGVDIFIDKGIPLCSGMGGSSACGAGVLVAMCTLFGIDTDNSDILSIASSVGSDVTYLMQGGCAVLEGKGDFVTAVPYVDRHFVVTTFDTKLLAQDVFRLYDCCGQVPPCDNHLQYAVEREYDFMVEYLQAISSLGLVANMTGSGSAYFVQCDSYDSAVQLAKYLRDNCFDSFACSSTQCGVLIHQ